MGCACHRLTCILCHRQFARVVLGVDSISTSAYCVGSNPTAVIFRPSSISRGCSTRTGHLQKASAAYTLTQLGHPGPVPLNFGGRARSGAFDAVWPSATKIGAGRISPGLDLSCALRSFYSEMINQVGLCRSTCGLVAMTSTSHAEGPQFDPGQVYRVIEIVGAHGTNSLLRRSSNLISELCCACTTRKSATWTRTRVVS